MVRKSYGSKRGTRKKLVVKNKPSITRYLREFTVGDRIHINILASSRAIPCARLHGKTGFVVEKRGRAYVVKINDLNKEKILTVMPEHMVKIR